VRKGSVDIGGSVHHSRIYAWRDKKGDIRYGQVRVFAGEFPLIGINNSHDLFTVSLPWHSQSMLLATPSLLERIRSGEAQEIGWVTTDDELEFDPTQVVGKGLFFDAASALADGRWIISGLVGDAKMSLVPAQLALEGMPETAHPAVRQILNDNRARLAVNEVFNLPELHVIRRTALGRPRWATNGHLPSSWRPSQRAEERL